MRAIRIASICHNDDDANDPNHRRVRLELRHGEDGYRWIEHGGPETSLPVAHTVGEAMDNLHAAYGSSDWALRLGR